MSKHTSVPDICWGPVPVDTTARGKISLTSASSCPPTAQLLGN